MSLKLSILLINSSVSFLQCSQSGLNKIRNNGLFFLRSLSVKIVVLSVNNNLSGGTVGNLLYGGSGCVCPIANTGMKQKSKRISLVFIAQRNIISFNPADSIRTDNFPFTLCRKAV